MPPAHPSVVPCSMCFLRLCLDFGKLDGKEKNQGSYFLPHVWFEESCKEKKLREKLMEKLPKIREVTFLQKK